MAHVGELPFLAQAADQRTPAWLWVLFAVGGAVQLVWLGTLLYGVLRLLAL